MPLIALVAGFVRWLIQGSNNLYTDADKRFYVPDPDLGWRALDDGPPWLGLELLAIVAAIACAAAVAGWLIRRRERKTLARATAARLALWFVAGLPLGVPVWAFAGGGAPSDAVEYLPAGLIEAPVGGVTASLDDMPSGIYRVAGVEGSAITAHIRAGGDEFDARFAGGVGGTWRGNPADLTQPMAGAFHVDTASVDTGIALRSKQAREDLGAVEYPQLSFSLTALTATRAEGPDAVAFSARGQVTVRGEAIDVGVTGLLQRADAEARARLGTNAPTLIVRAELELDVRDTPLRGDADSYDDPIFHITATIILVLDDSREVPI